MNIQLAGFGCANRNRLGARLRDLFLRAGNKVPPHQDLFGERRSADEQQPCAISTGKGGCGSHGAKVVEHSRLQRLTIDRAVAIEHEDRMLERRGQRDFQGASGMQLHIRAQ